MRVRKRRVRREAQVGERIWLVTFMQYDLGYFDDETCRLEPIDNPFGPKVLPMCSAPSVRIVVARLRGWVVSKGHEKGKVVD